MKQCGCCKEWKELDEFGKCSRNKDGLRHSCKACISEQQKKYISKNRDKVRAKYRRRYLRKNASKIAYRNAHREERQKEAKERSRKRNRDRYQKNADKLRVKMREYRLKNADKYKEYRTNWRKKNKAKIEAHDKLNNAIRCGLVIRKPCIICGDPKSHGHHEDYSKPLDVIWLCCMHHNKLHTK